MARIALGMRNTVPRSPSAVTAIAAVLALSAIPAAAQEVQSQTAPSLSLPQDVTTAPATPTTPTVTLPPESTAPTNVPTDTTTTAGTAPLPATPQPEALTAQQTVVLPDAAPPATPDDAASDPAPAPVQAETRTAARAAPAPTPTRPSVPTAQNNGTAADGALAQGAVPPAAPAPARPEVAPSAPVAAQPAPAAATNGNGFPVAEVAGILAALGVAGLGIAAMRRRRSDPVYEEADYAPTPLEPVPAPAPVAEVPPPVVAEPVRREAVISGNSATAILAASPLPQTAEERYELLDAMAAAEPDEGNPFTSRKGRLRRARLQLQHREREEATGQRSAFDFRTYRPSTKTAGTSTPATTREFTEA